MSATNMPPLTAMLSDEMWERLRVMWGSSALVQEMREELACTRSEHVAAPDVLTITNPEMLEHLRYQLKMGASKIECLEAELAHARTDLAAAQDRLTWPRWAHAREGGVLELRSPTFVLLAVVWDAHNDTPAGWRAWHGPVGSGPPCPWEQGVGGIDEAEAYLVQHGRIRPGCTIRPPPG